LAVHPSLPAKTTAELIALAKGKPGELNYGGLGAGSGPHLSMELLQDPMMFVSTGLVVQPWKAGQLRLLGVGAGERLAQLPDLPTIAESLPGFTAVVWFGLFAPTGTPREIVTKINNAVQRILADPGFRDKFLTPNFYEPVSGSPEQFAEHIRSDAQRWQKVIRDAKIAAEE
jgi:tripartite-type tricarboxylate transporter receptor subunit TctC